MLILRRRDGTEFARNVSYAKKIPNEAAKNWQHTEEYESDDDDDDDDDDSEFAATPTPDRRTIVEQRGARERRQPQCFKGLSAQLVLRRHLVDYYCI